MPQPVPSASIPMRLGRRGLTKACAWCCRVWDRQGRWSPSETGNLQAECTHGICDDCSRQHFPDVGIPG